MSIIIKTIKYLAFLLLSNEKVTVSKLNNYISSKYVSYIICIICGKYQHQKRTCYSHFKTHTADA